MTLRDHGRLARSRFGTASLWLSFLGGVYLLILLLVPPILGALLQSAGFRDGTAILRFFGALTLVAPLVLVLQLLAITLGTVALFRHGLRELFALLGVTLWALASYSLIGMAVYFFSAPLNSHEADPYGPVEVVHPPKQNQPPPESTLSSKDQTISAAPTFWCKYVQSTMFCKGHEVLPLPPSDGALEVPVGSTLLFDYGGTEDLGRRPNGMAPSHAPLYVGGVRLGEGWVARDGPGGLRVLENPRGSGRSFEKFDVRRLGERADNRFSIDRGLPVGDYVIHFLTRMPQGEANYYFRVHVVAEEAGTEEFRSGSAAVGG